MIASIRRFPTSAVSPSVAAPKTLSFLVRLFGCRHHDMSRPFTIEGESFKTCLNCGARRCFDPRTYEMRGPFYFVSPSQK